jgi:hypothetical protein
MVDEVAQTLSRLLDRERFSDDDDDLVFVGIADRRPRPRVSLSNGEGG